MPLKLLLTFKSSIPIPVSSLKPKVIHGLFFSILSEDSGKLFHSPLVKPFSLFFAPYFKLKEKSFKKFSLELNVLDFSLFPYISRELLIPTSSKRLYIDRAKIELDSVKVLESKTYEEILDESELGKDFIVDFLTPTAFKRGKYDYFLPEPKLIFKNLIRRWNKFSPEKIDFSLLDYIEKNVVLHGCWIDSQKVEISESAKLTGFKGRVLFYCEKGTEENKLVGALLRFAEFSGVGRKTTMGFGKIKLSSLTENQ